MKSVKKVLDKAAAQKTKDERDKFMVALNQIASMGKSMKEDIIDWKQIGKNATYTAREALRQRCAKCGK